MGRLPIRLRLTVVFAAAMAAVLAATGAFLYVRLASTLDETVDEGLALRAAELRATVGGGVAGLLPEGSADDDERVSQVLGANGAVLASAPAGLGAPLVDAAGAARAAGGDEVSLERDEVPGVDGRVRLLAGPLPGPGRDRALVVGASLEDRDDALAGLLEELLLATPAALLAASLLGYGLASAALRPVESMRAEAAAISAADPDRRLPLPASRDEVRRLGETLNAMLARLHGALERERAFVADASHELRTPLALLKAELDLALRRPRSPADAEAALRSAADETDRLVRLAEDLLVLARSDQGRLPLRRERLPVAELLRRVVDRHAPRADARGRELAAAVPDGLVVDADALRLEQALGNLVENALVHGDGPVRVIAEPGPAGVELHVLDRGPGLPADFAERAFDRFSRSDAARSGGGAGLGLAIVDVIARAHGGSARVQPREGGGADVSITIPARAA